MKAIKQGYLIVLCLTLSTFHLFSQQTPEGVKAWKSASKSYEKENFSKSIESLREAITAESQAAGAGQEPVFMQKAYRMMASCFEFTGQKDSALRYYFLAVQFTKTNKDTVQAADMIMRINKLYHLCRTDTGDIWLQRLLGNPETRSQFVMYKTMNLDTIRYDWRIGDTCWFKCNGGLNDGVYYDAAVGFYSIYKPSYRERPMRFLGEGKITYSYAQSARGYIVFNEDFFDTIYVTDGIYADTKIPENKTNSDIYKCAIAGFSSSTPNSELYYIYPTTSLYFTDPFYTTAIYNEMQKELHQKANTEGPWYGYDPMSEIKDGRFQGLTLREALKQSTIYDVQHFVNIPGTYRSTYYNYTQEFCYEYIWWLMNSAYTGANQEILWELITSMPEGRVESDVKKYGFYYNYWPLLDSFLLVYVDSTGEYSDQLSISQKILRFAENSGSEERRAKWLEQLSSLTLGSLDYKNAYDYSQLWLKTGYKRIYAHFYAGIAARFVQKYPEAISSLDSVLLRETEIRNTYDTATANWMINYATAYRAWCYFATGNSKDGIRLAEKSFNADSANRVSRMFYAFAKAFSGEFPEAGRHFDAYLELLYSPLQFKHTQLCFEEMIGNGYLSSWFTQEYNRVNQNFQRNYLHKLINDSMIDRAALRYKKGAVHDAYHQYLVSLDYSKKYLPRDSANLLFLLDWLGYIGVELNEDSAALMHYIEALEVCEKFNFNIEKINLELDNIVYTANLAGKTPEYRKYLLRYREVQAIINRQKTKNLYVLSCGTNTSTQTSITEKFAEDDARAIVQVLREKGRLYYDSVIALTLTGAELTLENLNNAFDSLSGQSGSNDAFVFYYAGPTRDKNSYIQLNLSDDFFLASELSNKLSDQECEQKIVLIDGGNLPVDSLFNSIRKFDKQFTEHTNLLLGTKDWRHEPEGSTHGNLTGNILQYLNLESDEVNITSPGLVSYIYEKQAETDLLMSVTSIQHGYGTILGRRPLKKKNADTSYPVIKLYNARKLSLRGDNIPVRVTEDDQYIRGEISDPAGLLIAFINGKLLPVLPNGRFNYPKNLLKSDTFEIRAMNKNGFMDSVFAVIEKSTGTVASINKKFAWFFVTNDYYSAKWEDLENPEFDAETISQILHDHYGFKIQIVASATSNEMLEKLRTIKKTPYKKGDQLLIYIAGHGYLHPDDGFKLVCKDAESPDSNVFKNYISGAELMNILDEIDCQNKFLIMDVCHAGSLAKEGRYEPYKVVSAKLNAEDFINRQKEIPVFQFYFSGRLNNVEDGVRGSHSPFARQLIDNLSSGARTREFVNIEHLKINEVQFGDQAEWMPISGYWSRKENGEFLLKVTTPMKSGVGGSTGGELASVKK